MLSSHGEPGARKALYKLYSRNNSLSAGSLMMTVMRLVFESRTTPFGTTRLAVPSPCTEPLGLVTQPAMRMPFCVIASLPLVSSRYNEFVRDEGICQFENFTLVHGGTTIHEPVISGLAGEYVRGLLVVSARSLHPDTDKPGSVVAHGIGIGAGRVNLEIGTSVASEPSEKDLHSRLVVH
ncbi:hypothetical protein KC347_g250 [Hortaea werneckii]|nr:hypothetical protein KC347_g250 [Hortaea werneckii]